jgi:hypothetical protein
MLFRSMLCLLPMAVALPAQLAFSDLEKRAGALAAASPQLVRLTPIGKSAGGKSLHLLRVAAAGKVDPDQRPAIFVGANIVGYHHAASQAALHLAEKLVARKEEASIAAMLSTRTFYIAPALNPDAHDAVVSTLKRRRSGNADALDLDRDGLKGEDGPNDLNGDGLITQLRVPHVAGDMMVDPNDPRLMLRADPLKGQKGTHRVYTEGFDDDKDGLFNEDPTEGYYPDRNFAHGWDETDPGAGPFAGYASEVKSTMDFLVGHRNVALAFVLGPANNLLELPRGSGTASDPGTARLTVPRNIASALGLDAERQYTLDEVWAVAQASPAIRGQGVTRDQLAQALGGGPASAPDAEDLRYYEKLAEDYKKNADKLGGDSKRSVRQSARASLQNWLYYQYGVMAVELDVWGIPKKKAAPAAAKADAPALTLDKLEKMSNEEFLALGEPRIAEFLKEVKAPPMVNAAMLVSGVKEGRMTPARMAGMMKQMGGTAAAPAAAPAEASDVMSFVDANKTGFVNWTPVTLPDGTKGEVGGLDPFVEITPPAAALEGAMQLNTDTILDAASKLAQVELAEQKVAALAEGLWKVTAIARNSGFLPTHTRMGARARSFLPVRLELTLPAGASLMSGARWTNSERMTGSGAVFEANWIVRAPRGTKLNIGVFTPNAGNDAKEIVLQ